MRNSIEIPKGLFDVIKQQLSGTRYDSVFYDAEEDKIVINGLGLTRFVGETSDWQIQASINKAVDSAVSEVDSRMARGKEFLATSTRILAEVGGKAGKSVLTVTPAEPDRPVTMHPALGMGYDDSSAIPAKEDVYQELANIAIVRYGDGTPVESVIHTTAANGDMVLTIKAVQGEPPLRFGGAIEAAPLRLILHCPRCRYQHVDDESFTETHRSHLCRACNTVWRPADVPSIGVRSIDTRGKDDTWP